MSLSGTVKFFSFTKGYGFISGADGEDVFVHVSVCDNPLKEGDEVKYDVEFNEQKQKSAAVNVTGGSGWREEKGDGKGKGKKGGGGYNSYDDGGYGGNSSYGGGGKGYGGY